MLRFLARKLSFFLFALLLLSVVVFWITKVAPGNIAYNILGVFITPEQEASFNNQTIPPQLAIVAGCLAATYRHLDCLGNHSPRAEMRLGNWAGGPLRMMTRCIAPLSKMVNAFCVLNYNQTEQWLSGKIPATNAC